MVTWRADLLVWTGSSWALQTAGSWATPYAAPDGEWVAPEFDPATLNYGGPTFVIPRLSRYYSIRITIHWYAVGSIPATEATIVPEGFYEPSGGYWLTSPGAYCDYTPKVGIVVIR